MMVRVVFLLIIGTWHGGIDHIVEPDMKTCQEEAAKIDHDTGIRTFCITGDEHAR